VDEWVVNAVRAVRALEAVFGQYWSICRKQKDKNGSRPLVVEWNLSWLELLVAADDANGSGEKMLTEALAKRGVE
jgi:hypothetical protein